MSTEALKTLFMIALGTASLATLRLAVYFMSKDDDRPSASSRTRQPMQASANEDEQPPPVLQGGSVARPVAMLPAEDTVPQ